MRKSSPKEKSHRLHASAARAVLALVVVALLAVPIAVQAELQATNLTYSWDTTTGQLEWGHVTIEWNIERPAEEEIWIPLLQEIKYDRLDRPSEPPDPPLCDPGDVNDATRYAGWIEYGLPYVDNDPAGAPGFQESRAWHLIDCDLNRDGTWDQEDDLLVGPLLDLEGVDSDLVLADCTTSTDTGENCRILPNPDPATNGEFPWIKDLQQPCGTETDEHCSEELATRLWINVDTNCDGDVDVGFPVDPDGEPERLCVYAEAKAPPYDELGELVWTFPLPIRISDVNGAKTLMLYPSPDAVELAFFGAEPQGRDVVVSWQTATEQDNLGFNLYRTNSAGGERVQLNERLIPSQNLGSSIGSNYQFVDRSAEPDTAYHYWLEDIDMDGVTGLNGPAAVQTLRARLLPCRPRPAPIPPGQIQ